MGQSGSTKRKQQAIATRTKILNTSIQLIREKGYAQVTVDHICEACGLSKGAFYHHFRSKLDIISESETRLNELLETVYEEDMDESIKERILLFINSMLAEVERNGIEIAKQRTIYTVESDYPKENGSKTFSITSRHLLQDILQQAVSKGELKKETPIDEINEIIMVFVSGMIADWCIFNGKYSLTERSWKLSFRLIDHLMAPYWGE